MSAQSIAFLPSRDEAARQAFVGALKYYLNFAVEPRLQAVFDERLAPDAQSPPANRADADALLNPHPLMRFWASLTFYSQTLLWQSIDATTRRTLVAQMAVADRLAANPGKLGSLHLKDGFEPPAPVRTTEIHRQPGGYLRESVAGDLSAALSYMGSVDLYRNAKGMGTGAKPGQEKIGTGAKPGADDMGRWLAGVARRRAPDLAPSAILDMGCGTGEQTLAYRREWPGARVVGIDCARPFVRLAHALAEDQCLALDFHEGDAAATGFAEASFDLVFSIILFHETSAAQVRAILRESWRLIRPGGLVLHLDVPYQPHRMPLARQVTNHWQVRHNGEPFWTGFVELDMAAELQAAGFSAPFADYEPFGVAPYFVFGGRKPA